MSFGGANISAGWLTGVGPASSTTTSRIINTGGKVLVIGNTTGDFVIQGFQVRAGGDGGQFVICFDPSGTVQWVQSPVAGLPKPTIVSVVAQDGRGVVNWTTAAAAIVSGYTVDVSGAGTYSVSGGATASLDVSGLTNAVTYPVQVRSVNGAGASAYSSAVSVRPMPVPPAPTGLSISVGNKLLDISWTAPALTYVDGYTIDLNGIQYDVSKSAVTRRITGLLTDVAYTVKIRSYNNAYASTYTASQVVTIPYVAVAPTAYRTIAGGGNNTAVIFADGNMQIWGFNGGGQLGNGNKVTSLTPVTPCNVSNCVSVAIAGIYTAVLLADGTTRMFGGGANGRLGIGTTIDMSSAVTPCNISNCVAITCGSGSNHTVALLADGTVRTWGRGDFGQLGNGGLIDMSRAVTPTGISNCIGIAVGVYHSAALLADGTVRTWGSGGNGQLGNGLQTASQTTAVTPIGVSNCVAVQCGANTTSVLLADGTVRIWGAGSQGQLGIGSAIDMSTAVTPCNISNCVGLSTYQTGSRVLLADSTVRAWGNGTGGMLGIGTQVDMSRAVTPCNISNCVAITGGGNHSMALLADGTTRTWGTAGGYGTLGLGTTIDMSTAVTPCNISNVGIVRSDLMRGSFTLPTGISSTVANIFDNTAYGFNPGMVPYLGVAVVGVTGSWEFARDGSSAFTAVSGVSPTSALLLRGTDSIRANTGSLTLKAWNGMGSGALSAVDTTVSGATVAGYAFGASTMSVSALFQRPVQYRSIAGGGQFTAALLADGTMRTWGRGASGQLGNGTTTASQLNAVTPTGVSNIVAIACGFGYTAALLADGSMRTWGDGNYGVLGIMSTTAQTTAVTPCNINNVVAIACGSSHGAALLADGTMRTWGLGSVGQLGIGTQIDMSSAVTPCNISNCVAIACAYTNTAALLADGTIRTWGYNIFGQLGIGSVGDMSTAVTPCNISNCIAIACGQYHTTALLVDGTIRTWGLSTQGRLGNNAVTGSQLMPVTPCNISNVVAIACGQDHTAALLADGTMRTWGIGSMGQIGNGLTIDMSIAVTPTGVSNVVAITCGREYTVALISDSTLRTWGAGAFGQLGNGTTTASQTTAVTVTGVSNVAIVRPAFKAITLPMYNNFPLSLALADLSVCYQPGTVTGRGIAIVGAVGSWEVSVNSGSTWAALGAVSASSAVTLQGDPTVRLRSSAPGTDTLTVKAWSEQQAVAALRTNGVDTTVATATIQGYSFSTDIVTMTSTTQPAPPVPTLVSAVGGLENLTVTFNASPTTFIAGYTIDVGGVTYNVTTSPVTITGVAPGTVAVRVRSFNGDGVASEYSTSQNATVLVPAPITYRSIVMGQNHTAALLADGTMRIWGNSSAGQLGNGTSPSSQATAVTPCNISNAVSIATGGNTTGGILADGTIRMWGSNWAGQLGDGSTATWTTPVTSCNISNCVAIALGGDHTAAILADGTMRTFGTGFAGRLGIGTTIDMSRAVTPCNISNCIAIACGGNHTAALLADGTMRTWGNGGQGRLGIGSIVDMSIAVTPCNISNCVAISAGLDHTAALLADGTMRTWGAGGSGQLGNGTTTASQATAVTPTGVSNVVAIACGNSHTIALLADGTMRAWGNGGSGRLGNGSSTNQTTAVTPTGVSNVVAITAGTFNTAVLLSDGTVRIWGENSTGELGVGGTGNFSTPVTPCNISNVAIVRPSFKVALTTAVNQDLSSAYFLNINTGYQPGTVPYRGLAITATTGTWQYSTNSGSTWTTVNGVTATAALALRLEPTVRIKCTAAGVLTMKAWSAQQATPATATSNVDTTVATATIQGYSFAVATTTISVPIPPTPAITGVYGSEFRADISYSMSSVADITGYIIDVSGVTYTSNGLTAAITGLRSGVNSVRVKSVNTFGGESAFSAPVNVTVIAGPVPPVPALIGVAGGSETIMVTFSASPTTYITGYTVDIGGVTYNVASSPATITGVAPGTVAVKVLSYNPDGIASAYSTSLNATVFVGAPITYRSIAASDGMTAALLTDGTMRIWGSGFNGRLGTGVTIDMSTAVTPCNISNCMAVIGGPNNTSVLLTDGTIRTWGAGASGRLGIGTTTTMTTAVTPCNISNVVAIASLDAFQAALLSDGTIRTWGRGDYGGPLGIGKLIDMSIAVTPCNISNCVAIACGSYHMATLLADGTMRTWGLNNTGMLGISTTIDMSTSVTPCNISNCVAIACGFYNTAALLADGTMRIWGGGNFGQLGIGSTANMLAAVTPCNISNCVAISCGQKHTAALLADGTMRTWGSVGGYGLLGIGTNLDMSRAATPCNISNIVAIACGDSHTAALLADGTMQTWGSGGSGRLGIGSTAPMLTAVTPCNISNVAIVKPSFKISLNTFLNLDISSAYFSAITTGYQPGTVPYRGLAITATTGTWQYSTNSGSTWTTVNGVTATAALALRLEPTVRIKCTVAGVLTVKAWSAMQATPATVTSNVDTTVATATIQGYSFAAATTTITAS